MLPAPFVNCLIALAFILAIASDYTAAIAVAIAAALFEFFLATVNQ